MSGKRRFFLDYNPSRDAYYVKDSGSTGLAPVCDQIQSTVEGISDLTMAVLVAKGLNRLAEEGEFDLDDRKGERRVGVGERFVFAPGAEVIDRRVRFGAKVLNPFLDVVWQGQYKDLLNRGDERRGERRKVRGTRKDRR